jgi:hypothetical protein
MALGLEVPADDQEFSPAKSIAKLMHQRISNYLNARSDPSLYQSVRNMSQFVSDDYGNRSRTPMTRTRHHARMVRSP